MSQLDRNEDLQSEHNKKSRCRKCCESWFPCLRSNSVRYEVEPVESNPKKKPEQPNIPDRIVIDKIKGGKGNLKRYSEKADEKKE